MSYHYIKTVVIIQRSNNRAANKVTGPQAVTLIGPKFNINYYVAVTLIYLISARLEWGDDALHRFT